MRSKSCRCLALVALGLSPFWAAHAASSPPPSQASAADYARAEQVLDYNLRGKVKNARVIPHWLADEDVFWYRHDTDDGHVYLLVDASSGAKQAAFDSGRIAAAVSKEAPDAGVQASNLLLADLQRDGNDLKLTFSLKDDRQAVCSTRDYRCSVTKSIEGQEPGWLLSPDGTQALFARQDNLWVRDLKTGDERPLTTDGVPYFSYGKLPEASLATIPVYRNKTRYPPYGIAWSPDGKTLIGLRLDERAVLPYPYVEWVPQDGSFRPIEHQLRLRILGDRDEPQEHDFVIDVPSAKAREFKLPDGYQIYDTDLAWSADNLHAFVLATPLSQKEGALIEVDVHAAAVRPLIRESTGTSLAFNQFIYNPENVRILRDGREAIWFSERDGWGHLYLYDLSNGNLIRQLTRGSWLVRDILAVDEAHRELFFTAAGREPGEDPYYRHIYRVSLDGGEPVLLTPENAEHGFDPAPGAGVGGLNASDVSVSPSRRYLVDTYSTVDTPPVTLLRSARDGRVIATLEQADAGAVYAAGWKPPVRIHVKAADGKTDIYGVIYFPPDYHNDGRYPVIDAFYGGPQIINAPRDFNDAVHSFNPVSRSSLAQLGFIVITFDARGTPGRSKAFHDVSYGDFVDPQIEDQVAAIKQLAQRYGGFDLDHVGVYGHSFGGYTSTRAILAHPEFFKVAVSSAGPQNWQGFGQDLQWVIGIPEYSDGGRFRPTPTAVPKVYKELDNATLAGNLRGHLMLVYGDMDENAFPAVTLQLADALEKANKTFDLLYLPNRTHSYFRTDAYYTRRMWDYFVSNLALRQPPENYSLRPPAPN